MEESAFRRKQLAPLAFLIGIIVVAGSGLGVFAAILSAAVRASPSSPLVVGGLASIIAFLILPVLQIAFEYLRTARASVSPEGLVPRKWTILDVLHRRRIIRWSEIYDIRVERHPRGPWWISITLTNDNGFRYVRSAKGVPDAFLALCEDLARLNGVPVIQESP